MRARVLLSAASAVVCLLLLPCALSAVAAEAAPQAGEHFTIHVVDDATGRGVPLVELKTTSGVRYWTDSAGVVAFHEPGLMGSDVFFQVSSHGYEFPQDGFGFRGKALEVTPGGSATLRIKRLNIAERLYRVTGEGIYRDTVLVGVEPPIEQPLLNAQVTGSDSVMSAVYQGRVYWFWGDTNRPKYPLGNFHVPGATSKLPGDAGLDPAVGVNLDYFTGEDGFAKATCRMPGEGPTWIDGLVTVPDGEGGERLFAHYVKVRPPLSVYRHGLAEWDDEANEFRSVTVFPDDAPFYPGGHPLKHREGDVEYVYFATPYPLLRLRATAEALADLSQYESFTCLVPGSTRDEPRFDRDGDGQLRYGWKRGAPPVGPAEQRKFVQRKLIRPDEGLLQLRDHLTGASVLAHAGSVAWNEHRRRWVMIAVEQFGTSFLGEVWYAEADSPVGPWVYAVKVVTHEKYSFYNPRHHPFFDADGGRTIYFEGTYAATFSGNEQPTPRYDYNQMMYRLDLSHPRLVLPVAVCQSGETATADALATRGPDHDEEPHGRIAFFAADRPFAGSRAVRVVKTSDAGPRLMLADDMERAESRRTEFHSVREGAGASRASGGSHRGRGRSGTPSYGERVLFDALPADADDPPDTTVPLYEFHRHADGRFAYATAANAPGAGWERAERPLCRVWASPFAVWPPSAREREARR